MIQVVMSQGMVYSGGTAIGILIPVQFYELLHRDCGALCQNLHRHNGLIRFKLAEVVPDKPFQSFNPLFQEA
jgi:hypothetical protein